MYSDVVRFNGSLARAHTHELSRCVWSPYARSGISGCRRISRSKSILPFHNCTRDQGRALRGLAGRPARWRGRVANQDFTDLRFRTQSGLDAFSERGGGRTKVGELS